MKLLRLLSLALLFATLTAVPAYAQFETLAGLASNFSDLAIQWGAFTPRVSEIRPESNPKSRWIGAYGAEFIFEIAKVSTAKPDTSKPECIDVGRGDPRERQITYTNAARDSMDIYALVSKCKKPDPDLQLEFGVGFFQTSRFSVNDAIGAMTGVFRETPSLSVYATYLHGSFRPYGAIRTGVTELVSPTIEDPLGRTFSATAPKSVEVGFVGGIARRLLPAIPLNFFVEGAYMYRPFTGISWAPTKDAAGAQISPPAGARKRLNFSGRSAMLGFQVTVKDPNKK